MLAASTLGVSSPAAAQTQPFTDTPQDAFYSDAVNTLADRGLFEGTLCAQGMLCPGDSIDRKTMAVWIVRTLDGQDPAEIPTSRFSDVAAGSFHAPFIERMAQLGVTAGCGGGNFCPDGTVNRDQMAVFLTAAFDLEPGPDPGFTGVAPDAWYHDQVAALAASGITAGCGDDIFCPKLRTLRGQMALFLYKALEQQEAQPEFITEENDVSRWIKRGLIDEYGDKWPWLKEVWDYTNREDFKYSIGGFASAGFQTSQPAQTGDVFKLRKGDRVQIATYNINNPRTLDTLVHELAHIYTLSHGAASNPEPMAIAYLYFDELAQNACLHYELYAEAAEFLDASFNARGSFKWHTCDHLPSLPTTKAVTVVRQAFSGQMPDWFYETFQKSDGSLDYVKLWTAVKDSGRSGQNTVIPMLRDSFGGYCSEQAIWDTLYSLDRFELPPIVQPWRDGGCA